MNSGDGGTPCPVSIVIPTYGREQVLVDTVRFLLQQQPAAAEILVMDQTAEHGAEVERTLLNWAQHGAIRWHRLERPSITGAMNRGLAAARSPIVLFVDDDIVPAAGLVAAHARNYVEQEVWAVAGQVLQPGQSPRSTDADDQHDDGRWQDMRFVFCGTERRTVKNCMAGNLSVRRDRAIDAGGFDENFVRVAYRFETEFARRLTRHGGRIVFEPGASIRHLQAGRGGTRSYGDHLRTLRPDHSVGDYYFAFREAAGFERMRYIGKRLVREIRTRHHLRRPWWIPLKLWSEFRGLFWAYRLACRGPKYIDGLIGPPEDTP